MGIDDNNCITNVESQIIAIETLIKQKSKTEVINDVNLIANNVANRIQELPIGTEFSISELLEDYKFESKELFNITFEILKKLEELNIALENSYGENAIIGLPYNIKYVKIKKEVLHMQIENETINTKEELLNVIRNGKNPLNYVKKETDIDFISKSLVIEGTDEDSYYEELAEVLLKSILYYILYTDNEEKTLARCKSIVEIGINDTNGKEKVCNLLKNEERASVLYKGIEIASEKTASEIYEKLKERLDKLVN